MMRIITGKAKGIRLKTLEGESTRPTAERVKESVFSMLQFDLEGREILDVFAGSGQMGLEAVSRGAAHVTLVDQSKDAIRIIQENVSKTKLTEQCTVYQGSALDYIRRNQGKKVDIVFLDPPYASGLYAPVLRLLYESEILKPTTVLVCESDTELIFGEDEALISCYEMMKRARYGKIVVTLLKTKQED
jgi:16S rRNA (guanine(966)-N(2))-methyltransferase RsmD